MKTALNAPLESMPHEKKRKEQRAGRIKVKGRSLRTRPLQHNKQFSTIEFLPTSRVGEKCFLLQMEQNIVFTRLSVRLESLPPMIVPERNKQAELFLREAA